MDLLNNYFHPQNIAEVCKRNCIQQKDLFVPDYEIEAEVQEVDEELKKIILMIDFARFLEQTNEPEEEN